MYITTIMKQQAHNTKTMFFLIKELTKVLRSYQNEAAFCEGVTFTQFSILDLVAEKGILSLSELHKLLSVEKSTTTRLVNPLVEQKLLKKTESLHDSRAVELVITKLGKKVHIRVWECISGFMQNMMKEIPEEKINDVFNSLRIFIRACSNCCSSTCCS